MVKSKAGALILQDGQQFEETVKSMRKFVMRLEVESLPYAIIGGFAVRFWGHQRYTKDVDVLVSRQAAHRIMSEFVGNGYRVDPDNTGRIIDMVNETPIDIRISDDTPRWPSLFQNTKEIDGFQVIRLTRLIEMKLRTGRLQDQADVISLIKARSLLREFKRGLSTECVELWDQLFDRIEQGLE